MTQKPGQLSRTQIGETLQHEGGKRGSVSTEEWLAIGQKAPLCKTQPMTAPAKHSVHCGAPEAAVERPHKLQGSSGAIPSFQERLFHPTSNLGQIVPRCHHQQPSPTLADTMQSKPQRRIAINHDPPRRRTAGPHLAVTIQPASSAQRRLPTKDAGRQLRAVRC